MFPSELQRHIIPTAHIKRQSIPVLLNFILKTKTEISMTMIGYVKCSVVASPESIYRYDPYSIHGIAAKKTDRTAIFANCLMVILYTVP
jgi:hypothetical protein